MPVKSQNFLRGAFFLSLATATVKIIGALYKIPIQRLLGADGSSIYIVAYNIYAFLFVIATAGLPVAISKMVSESRSAGRNDAERVFSVAFHVFLVIGTVTSLFILLFADTIAALMNAEEAVWAIRATAPSVFLIVFICPYRGYYQGHGNMKPTAVSQVIEAVGKLIFGVGLTFLVLYTFMPAQIIDGVTVNLQERNGMGAAAAILGVSAGILFSAIYLIVRSRGQNLSAAAKKPGRSRKEILKEMISLAIPITLSSAVLSITTLIDTGMIRGILLRVFTDTGVNLPEQMMGLYHGAYTWSLTLYTLPSAFIVTIAVSLLPAIAAFRVNRDRDGVIRTTRSAIRVTALLGMPAAAGFITLAAPIINLLYAVTNEAGEVTNAEACKIAAGLLQVLGIAVIFVCIVTVTNSILQSLGLVSIPIVTMAVGAAAKLICTYTLVGNPDIHINGAPIGTIVCFAIISALNILVVVKATGAGLSLVGEMAKPLIAAAGMGAIALGCNYFFGYFLGEKLGVLFAIGVGAAAYFIILILIKGIPKRDIDLLPGGAKIAKILQIR
jgi:stage V sporulation protein B